MLALGMGLIAALAWGIHDLCVRSISRRADIAACLAGVFGIGLLLMIPVGTWLAFDSAAIDATAGADVSSDVTSNEKGGVLGIGSGALIGVLFACANYALYRAFAAGPVRIVAPITAAYPVVTVGLAALAGQPVAGDAWLAIGVVILGITLVASGSREGEGEGGYRPGVVIGWSAAAAVSYALTFAFGQHLSASGDAFTVLLVTRAVALLSVVVFMWSTGGLRFPPRDTWSAIALMAAMDVVALGLVFAAGLLPDAAYATVTASMFGVVTIVLARVVFKEVLIGRQWLGVLIAFAAIGWLGASG